MDTIGMVTISKQLSFRYIPKVLLRYIPDKIIIFLIRKFKKIKYDFYKIPNADMRICIAKLPFIEQQISQIGNDGLIRYFKEIKKFFEANLIEYSFMSEEMQPSMDLPSNTSNLIFVSNDKKIFFSLTVDILRKICKTAGIEEAYLNVGIIDKKFSDKSVILIKMISKYVKYINLITDETKKAEDGLENISEDIGLTVWISDTSNEITNMDIVFLLDEIDFQMEQSIVRNASIIFDFTGSFNNTKETSKNIIINDVELEVPWHNLNEEVLTSKDNIRIIQCMVYSKLNINNDDLTIDDYRKLRQEIFNLGCKIKKLKGKGIALNLVGLINTEKKRKQTFK